MISVEEARDHILDAVSPLGLEKVNILVHQRPFVAVVATGDELVDIDEPVSAWKIVNSNSYSLEAPVRDCGAIPRQIGIARDRREDLLAKFRAAMRTDLIVSSGGVSVGDCDLVKEIMQGRITQSRRRESGVPAT